MNPQFILSELKGEKNINSFFTNYVFIICINDSIYFSNM